MFCRKRRVNVGYKINWVRVLKFHSAGSVLHVYEAITWWQIYWFCKGQLMFVRSGISDTNKAKINMANNPEHIMHSSLKCWHQWYYIDCQSQHTVWFFVIFFKSITCFGLKRPSAGTSDKTTHRKLLASGFCCLLRSHKQQNNSGSNAERLISKSRLLIPWNRVVLKKLIILQLVKKFLPFYRSWIFVAVFATTDHLSLFWGRKIKSSSTLLIYVKSTYYYPYIYAYGFQIVSIS